MGREELSAAATRATFESNYDAVLAVKARRDRLDVLIEQMAAECEFTSLLQRLGCLRGIGTLTGFALAVEIGDWARFTGKSIGSCVGSCPQRVLLRPVRVPGLDHQDRQHSPATTPGRSRLAPPPTYRGVGKTMRDRGVAGARRPSSRRRRQPSPAPPLGEHPAPGNATRVANIAIARELAGW